ncbi:hypothetical protein ElyMa_000412000 [Elysia marginata]|uniref:Uncharacterized protein n=1 Tax=Elysia marginata TaxID=1093978 RepID=A0AAV4FL98_9GAST|nr:hypothetical protein ElyMa_000412000 [Elysia marginata]
MKVQQCYFGSEHGKDKADGAASDLSQAMSQDVAGRSSSSNSNSDSDCNPDETVDTLDESTIANSVPDTVIPASMDTQQVPIIIVELPSSFNTDSVPDQVSDTAAHDAVLEQDATRQT